MQVEVRHVCAELAGLGQADERVQVGAVDVHLAAGLVHQRADVADGRLEHPVGRRVGHHEGGQAAGVLRDLGAQVVDVDVALVVAGDDDDAHAGHDRAGGVGPVGTAGDEADVARGVAVRPVIGADREKPGELPLRSRVRLERHGVVSGDLDEPGLERADQLDVAVGLVERCERVHSGELDPGDGLHLRRRVELHRARAERDHRAVERDVAITETADVAQHRRLAAVRAEDRVGEEGRGATGEAGNGHVVGGLDAGVGGREDADHVAGRRPDLLHVRLGRGLVRRRRHGVRVDQAQVDPTVEGCLDDRLGLARHAPADGVEDVGDGDIDPHGRQARGQHAGPVVRAPRDGREALGSVVGGVHGRDHGEQDLRRADVAGGLLAADVLLARLEREAVCRGSVRVDAHADETTGHAPLESGPHRHEARMRAAEAEGHAESLRGADDDVSAQLARRREERQCEQVRRHDGEGTALVRRRDDGGEVAHAPGGAGVADQDARHAVGRQVAVEIGDDERDAERLRSRAQDRKGLRVRVGVDHDHGGTRLRRAQRERHRLRSRRGLVEQGGARDGKGRQVLDHRLEVEQRLEAPLGDLRLVGRVRRVPGRVLEDVAGDHAGRVRAVVAEPDHAGDDAVARGQVTQLRKGGSLGRGLGQVQGLMPPDDLRDHVGREGLEIGVAEQPEHPCLLDSVRTDVPGGELHAHDAPQGPGMPGHTR